MQIAQVNHEYYPHMGGVAILMKEMCEKLIERGFEITVHSLDLSEGLANQEKINGVLVKRYKPIIGDPIFFPSIPFLRDLKSENFDILHVHNIHSFPATFASLLKRRGQKLIVQTHYHRFGQTPLRNALFALYKHVVSNLVFKRADAIIVNSSYEEKIVKQDFSTARNTISLPQGLPMKELMKFNWRPENPKRILSVGALRKYKNVDKLIKAFNILLNNNPQDMRLIIIGDGPEKNRLVNLTRKLGITERVEWKHNLPKLQLFSEYSKATVFVSLSNLESFSRVIHEAHVIGIPVVTPNEGIIMDLPNNEKIIGIRSTKPEEISAAITKAISMTPTLTASNCIFPDINHYADQMAEIYSKLVTYKP